MNIIETLRTRFDANMHRHQNVEWSAVEAALKQNQQLHTAVPWMEDTGGMPDVMPLA